ncbi:MAG: hypothetical protein US57_C0002G0050 [Candidatus Moranbacteria bacterium GW2011_GWC2_37_73]|nr:MAG: hypothetical protein UR95_C0002G0148 [Parcubacteria group bacterium GW2011_GWC1_36_108]KKQ01009.1 MAG: hypothetical protein US09_C0003G0009 [Candidatus Moranbacteria bacterium GW2011_GWD1_36_198]KKQ02411.1 MAG: hypothetical protein US10_C0001G0009 [Candidatus Moranbacteria bacterium GW2011_GWD2_36_198]KKQ40343.1 MAG: hypothetical protein US57_C0002G0050 [Candidatus Moranbacteria bacterium GW2011_GWC2_37_73]HAS00149.1 hypothetical protein [Candidatus Moranbacteria bacterium]
MSKRISVGYGESRLVYLRGDAPIDHVPVSEKLGVSVEQLKDGYLVNVSRCRIYYRKTGIQFSPSDLVTFGWPFADIKSVQKSDGEVIWENPIIE